MKTIDAQILTELGYANLTDREKADKLTVVSETVIDKVGLRIATTLDDGELKQFTEILDTNDVEKINAWVEQHIPNYDQIVDEEIEKYIRQIKKTAEDLRNSGELVKAVY